MPSLFRRWGEPCGGTAALGGETDRIALASFVHNHSSIVEPPVNSPILSAALLALALVSCRAVDRAENSAPATGDGPAASSSAPAGAMPVPPNPDPPIPRLYHGRWGLVPADCTSRAGDAKGLMIVDGETIRFYESLATAQEELVGPEGSYTGRFAIAGEGQQWQAVMRFTRSGDTLTRSQDGSSYHYSRCP